MKQFLFALVPAALVVAGCGSPPERDAHADQAAVQVATVVAQTEPLAQTFEAGGSVRSRAVAVLSSRIVAPVVAVNVRAGDRVESGRALVVLDERELRASARQAEAALAAARENAAAAAADERAAASAVVLATATHRRIAGLRERNSATPAELDDAVAALESAQARASGSAARTIESQRAIDAAQAAARAAAVAQSYGTIAAPFTGVVTARSVDPGTLATPGVPLITLEDAEHFRIEVTVDASRAPAIAPGIHVPVVLDGSGGALDGVVAEVGQSIDPITHMFTVKIDLPRVAGLRSGVYGRARFAGPPRPVLAVPASAIQRRGQLALAFVEENGVARMRLIHSGAPIDGRVPVLAGLSDGDRVILSPGEGLADGARVTVAGRNR